MKRMGLMIATLGLLLLAQTAQADWMPAKRLTWTSGVSDCPAIAVDPSGNLHLVWADSTPGNGEIYYKRSTDGGTTWSTSRRITWTPGYSYKPAMAVDPSGTIHVVWRGDLPGNSDIYYTRSTDGGSIWMPTQRITWTSGFSYVPSIAADSSDNLHIVWNDTTPANGEIYYKKSSNQGATWAASQRLTWTSGISNWPTVALGSLGHVYVSWDDATPGNKEIYLKKSKDEGATWSTGQRLTWNSGDSEFPDIVLDPSGNGHAFWQDKTPGNAEIYYKRSTDEGASWTAGRRISWTSDQSYVPHVVADSSGDIHLVWYEYVTGNSEIYYQKSTDGGETWTASRQLTWTSGYSYFPALAVDSFDNLHVVWDDNTPGNYEVYYKKYVK